MSQNRCKSNITQQKLPSQGTSLASSQCDIPAYLRPVQSTDYHRSAYDYIPSSELFESLLQEVEPKSLKTQLEAAQSIACTPTPPQPPKRAAAVGDVEFSKDGIYVCLHETNTWNRFLAVGNEMIVTKPGR